MSGTHALRSCASLVKWRETSLLVMVALITAVMAGRDSISSSVLLVLGAVGLLSCGGSALLNNYIDRDIDAVALRTRGRPLPAGTISPRTVCWLGVASLFSGVLLALLKINWLVGFFTLLGAVFYVVLYTLLLKRKSVWNIEVGGLAGSCAALAGWFAASPPLSVTPFLMALLLFLWTPPHFWSFAIVHRLDYVKTGIPVLPAVAGGERVANRVVIYAALLLASSLLLYFLGGFGRLYLIGAMSLGGLFLVSCARMRKRPLPDRAWSNYKFSGIYLVGLLLIMLLEVVLR